MVLAAVLDLDGTLLDHPGPARRALEEWLDGLGSAATEEVVAAWFAAEERHFRAWSDGGISFAEQRRRRLRDVLSLAALPVGDDAALDTTFATLPGTSGAGALSTTRPPPSPRCTPAASSRR